MGRLALVMGWTDTIPRHGVVALVQPSSPSRRTARASAALRSHWDHLRATGECGQVMGYGRTGDVHRDLDADTARLRAIAQRSSRDSELKPKGSHDHALD